MVAQMHTSTSDAKHTALRSLLSETLGADLIGVEQVASLWSGYGEIVRCRLNADPGSVIVKHVQWPSSRSHPRGWNSDRSHRRKVRSYAVEARWYGDVSGQCDETCRVPLCLGARAQDDEAFMVLEDLDAAGFAGRRTRVSDAEINVCLAWLAAFHARFLGHAPDGLWPTGTYWHLATRPDEWAALPEGPLKRGAAEIDRRLNSARYMTVVHGDAKLANFCFSKDGQRVAAVDFQYVGGGCGIKDVAYFISSCLDEGRAEAREAELLDTYFAALRRALIADERRVDADALEAEWRALYPLAWTDFFRFLSGWSPGHWKIHRYSRRLADTVLAAL
jgi:hypothetical protein